jgi:hypothetical protein
MIPAKIRDNDNDAQAALLKVLEAIPQVKVERLISDPKGNDFELHVKLHGRVERLLCQVRSRAWPNELYAVFAKLRESIRSSDSKPVTPIIIAPYFSPQATQLCRELGLSWIDFVGNCELRLGSAYIRIEGTDNPHRKGRGTASLYSPQSSQVVHALLLDPHRKWKTEELARVSGVSMGQVANVRKLLAKQNWLRASYGETSLEAPLKLLEDWVENYKPTRKELRGFTLDSPEHFEKRVASTVDDYAFAELSAAHRYAPFTRHQRVSLYVPRWRQELNTSLGLRSGEGSSNVVIYETGSELKFVEALDGIRCTSPIQTYLDLRAQHGRSQDAADHLLETVIQQRWT